MALFGENCMLGKRVYLNEQDKFTMQPGDYGKDTKGIWWCKPPDNIIDVCSLEGYKIAEHHDKTISVLSLISFEYGFMKKGWQGYLEYGVWRACN